MQYVIMENGHVIWGIRDWNFRSMESCILDDCELTVQLPISEPNTFIDVSDNVKIYPAIYSEPSYNSKVQQLSGPFWTVVDNVAIGTFVVVDKDINIVRDELKKRVAANRYRDETKDINLNIQGTDIIVEGDRTNKITIISMTSLMDDVTPYNFKFPKSNNWLPMMKSDMVTLINSFVTQTQGAFNWEAAKIAEIDAATFEELDGIDVGDIILEGRI